MRFHTIVHILLVAVVVQVSCYIANHRSNQELRTDGCILPGQPSGGSYELNGGTSFYDKTKPGQRVSVNSFLNYKCDKGYTRVGRQISICTEEPGWQTHPKCIKTCPALQLDDANIVVCYRDRKIVTCQSDILPGTVATLSCNHPYKLPFADDLQYVELSCLDGGQWNPTPASCTPECGIAAPRANSLIVNGARAEPGVFPWHVAIYYRNFNGFHEQICGGSLISDKIVISAAHCFYDDIIKVKMDSSLYSVAAGKHHRSYNWPERFVQNSTVESIHLPNRYNGVDGLYANDIAWLTLRHPFNLTSLIRPICMDRNNQYESEELQIGKFGKAVGWGYTSAGVPSNELQEINLPFIPYTKCISELPPDFRPFVTSDKFCAGYLNGSSVCNGDSGGGLAFQRDGRWYLRGVISISARNISSCDNNYYTTFTNVGLFTDEFGIVNDV